MEPRTTLPNNDNKYYIRQPNGWSPCILGNEKRRNYYLNVLPNCVGYACGRFNEIGGYGRCKWKINMTAKYIYKYCQQWGLKTGTVPKPGALIVWSSDTSGHVAVVEKVISPTEILISQSGWSATKSFWTATRRKGDGNWTDGESWAAGKYKFLGFVYHPDVAEAEEEVEVKDLKVLCKGAEKTVKAVNVNGENYVRLRDMDEKLAIAAVSYDASRKLPVVEAK